MSAILLRKLTKKSKLKFGTYKDYTVEHLFGMRKQIDLTSMYFNLSNITFMDDILEELGITSEFRIDKPSKNNELYKIFMLSKYGVKQAPNKTLQRMKVKTKPYTKGLLMTVNHGH